LFEEGNVGFGFTTVDDAVRSCYGDSDTPARARLRFCVVMYNGYLSGTGRCGGQLNSYDDWERVVYHSSVVPDVRQPLTCPRETGTPYYGAGGTTQWLYVDRYSEPIVGPAPCPGLDVSASGKHLLRVVIPGGTTPGGLLSVWTQAEPDTTLWVYRGCPGSDDSTDDGIAGVCLGGNDDRDDGGGLGSAISIVTTEQDADGVFLVLVAPFTSGPYSSSSCYYRMRCVVVERVAALQGLHGVPPG
jgi:hypothetical protein